MSQQINLFTPAFRKQKKHFSAVAMLQALLLVIAGVAALYGYAVWQFGTLEGRLVDNERELKERRAQLVSMTKEISVQGRNKKLEEEVLQTEAQLHKRLELRTELITGVGGNVDGFSRLLTALANRTMNGVWLTSIAIRGKANDLVIKGRALSSDLVPAYVDSLGKEPALAGRAVSALQLATREGAPGPGMAAGEPLQTFRYIEFTLSIPLGGEGTPAPGPQKGAS
jgi:Tfp pilus assembly protein PilN